MGHEVRTHCYVQLRGALCPLRNLPSLDGGFGKYLLVRICACVHMPACLRHVAMHDLMRH